MSRVIELVHSLITSPAQPAMTVDHARRHIKALTISDDVLIRGWIEAARHYFEEQTGRQIITATHEVWLDAFPCGGRIELPHPPLQSVVSVLYVDSTGALASFSDGGSPDVPSYAVKAPQGPYAQRGWIEPLYGTAWPTARCESGAVRIQYTSGYGDTPEDVPELVTAILCFLVAHFDRFRGAVEDQTRGLIPVPYGVQMMLDGFKYSALSTQQLRSFSLSGFGAVPWL